MNVINLKEVQNKTLVKFVIFYCFGLIIFLFLPCKSMYDPDTYWHIKTGEWIVQNGIPRVDIFSWYGINNGLKWINHEWLFGVVIYFIYNIFQFDGVYYLSSILSITLYILIYKWCKKTTKSSWISIFTAIIALIGMIPNVAPRPQIFSYCLFVLFCIFLEDKKYYHVIPILIIGVNLHGGVYPIYLILAAYYLYKEVSIKRFFSLMAIYVLSLLINPYTYDIFLYTIKTFMYDRTSIDEWQPVILVNFPLIIVTVLLMFIFTKYSKLNFKDTLFITIFSVFSIVYKRNMIFIYILSLPVAAKYFKESIHYYDDVYISKLTKIKKFLHINEKNPRLNLFLVLVIIFIGYTPLITHKSYELQASNKSEYPVEAVEYIKNNKNLTHIMADYGDGGYLIFNDIPTMVDGRADLFTSAFNNTSILADYINVTSLKTDYRDFFQKYGVKYVLIKNNSSISYVLNLDSNINLIYQDKKYKIFKVNKE